ncbi:hypothetical protein [Paraburkholderia sp. CNPSo 3281]|uniref:hypothetical protein n=1 Tax=Paraburkholderia sp. CNPSo 3281 TaxID=2940933 RepID=UPI0020B899A2|nr:hypothetical protein [Paraburkholderia sp. CNPSo 3281]MCP3721409.1 hypothetical protein [Paraburkholderia sp. CNPSo 3281]
MAVDFASLPPEEPVPDNPPSRLLWTVIFFLIGIAGVFVVLFIWPKGEPTQTPWFWTCATVYPFGVAAFMVLRRYSVYEGHRLDAIAWNDAREDYVNDVFERASRPLGVLASTVRFASEEKEDDFGKLLDGSVKLEPQIALKPDAPLVNARWFEKPDRNKDGVPFRNDDERRRYVLAWAFSTVTDTVAEAVRSLPPDLRLKVQLMLPGVVDTDEALAIWERRWAWTDLRPVQVRLMPEPSDLMYADAWLDRVNRRLDEEARLLVCVRLNAICQALPLDGSAETIVALLVAPEAVCQKFALAPIAMFHRPNGTDDCAIDDALARTLRWGCSKPADIKRIWQGGLDGAGANAVTKAVVKAGIGAKVADIDYMVGHAGPAAPWFAVACAAKSAVQDGAPQLVATAGKTGVCFSVMRSVT